MIVEGTVLAPDHTGLLNSRLRNVSRSYRRGGLERGCIAGEAVEGGRTGKRAQICPKRHQGVS